jgi:hypothetical protein
VIVSPQWASKVANCWCFVLYQNTLRRFLFLFLAGFLVLEMTGVEAFVSAETCTSLQDTLPDGTCPPTCVRCACGAQVVAPEFTVSVASTPAPQVFIDLYRRRTPGTPPTKIFHVPKSSSLLV